MVVVGWILYVAAQLILLVLQILGYVVLLVPCALNAWGPAQSTLEPARLIDKWNNSVLDAIWGNPEDGVSGQRALIWVGGRDVPYASQFAEGTPKWAIAYCWSAARNGADGARYWFEWKGGPFYTRVVLGRTFQAGWKETGAKVWLPVLSWN